MKERGSLITTPLSGSYLRVGVGGGGGNTTPKNHVRSSLIERNYLKCWQNTDSLSGKENKTRMKA